MLYCAYKLSEKERGEKMRRKISSLEKKKEEARKLLNVLMKLDDTSLLLVENSINLLASRDAIEQQKSLKN